MDQAERNLRIVRRAFAFGALVVLGVATYAIHSFTGMPLILAIGAAIPIAAADLFVGWYVLANYRRTLRRQEAEAASYLPGHEPR